MLKFSDIKLTNLQSAKEEFVHPFYRDSIMHLFGVEISNEELQQPTRNRRIYFSELSRLLSDGEFSYFFDIRLQEELGTPSPQFEILSDLNLNKTIPISIGGSGIEVINEAILIIDSMLNIGEKAVCAISLLSCAKWQFDGLEFITSFIAERDEEQQILTM
jgi:hypothetical protein